MGLALIGYFTLTDRPATARWLTEEEKAIAIARVKSENVGSTEVLDGIDTAKVLRGIFNPNTLIISFIFLLDNITVQGLAFFLPTIIATIYPTYTTVEKQLQTVPPYVVGAFFVILIPFLSWKTNKRVIFLIATAPLMMCGYIMFLATDQFAKQTRFGATFLIASGAFPYGALCNAAASANALSDTARSAGIGTVVMAGNIGGLISTWSFLPFDGSVPRHIEAMCVLLTQSGPQSKLPHRQRIESRNVIDHILALNRFTVLSQSGQQTPRENQRR